MNNANPVTQLSPHLFWDVNPAVLDWEKDIALIIERVLQRGTLDEWKTIISIYSFKRIVETVKGMRTLDPVSLHFIAGISHSSLTEFRCYNTRFLTKHHWIY